MKKVGLLVILLGCHHGGNEGEQPASCVIEHDGVVTQCFDEIGATARQTAQEGCSKMHGKTRFQLGTPCPTEGVIASCTKAEGTEYERIERCYREPDACAARCAKADGVLTR